MGIEQSKKTLDKVIQDIAKREAMIEKTEDKITKTRDKLIADGVWDVDKDMHIGDFGSMMKRLVILSGNLKIGFITMKNPRRS